jgi:hypothetical protein
MEKTIKFRNILQGPKNFFNERIKFFKKALSAKGILNAYSRLTRRFSKDFHYVVRQQSSNALLEEMIIDPNKTSLQQLIKAPKVNGNECSHLLQSLIYNGVEHKEFKDEVNSIVDSKLARELKFITTIEEENEILLTEMIHLKKMIEDQGKEHEKKLEILKEEISETKFEYGEILFEEEEAHLDFESAISRMPVVKEMIRKSAARYNKLKGLMDKYSSIGKKTKKLYYFGVNFKERRIIINE